MMGMGIDRKRLLMLHMMIDTEKCTNSLKSMSDVSRRSASYE